MQEFLSVAFSIGFLFSTSFVLLSCLSCRRFIEKRKLKKEKKKEERVNIPDITIDLGEEHEEKQENGITNLAYTDVEAPKAREEEDSKEEITKQKDDVTKADEQLPTNDIKTTSNNEEINAAQKEKEIVEEEQEEVLSEVVITSGDESEIDFRPSSSGSVVKSDDEVFVKIVSEDEELNEKAETTKIYDEKLTEEELEAYTDVVFQGEWRRPVALRHLLETGLINKKIADEAVAEAKATKEKIGTEDYDEDEEVPKNLRKFLCGEEPIAGILVADSGEKKSIFKSAKEGILRRGTAISLLEAQAATGNIIDPVTGRKMSVKEAAQLGLLDRVYETVLLRAERAVTGYKFRASDHVLSLHEAMQKGLVVESHGLRLLEAQCATGGVIDHRINIRVPLDVAVQRGLLDERLKEKLEDDDGDETKTFFDPNTEENVTYKELMRRSVMDPDTGLRLYHLEKIAKKRISYGSYSGRSSQASSKTVSRSNSRENIPAALANSPL